jgi:opacity protein-like surface antigen
LTSLLQSGETRQFFFNFDQGKPFLGLTSDGGALIKELTLWRLNINSNKECFMKKCFACAVAIFAFFYSFPSIAYGDDGGLYLAARLGMSSQQVERRVVAHEALTSDFGDTLNSRHIDLDDFSQGSFVGGVAVGYDFYPRKGWPLRAELEFLARSYKEVRGSHSANLSATIDDVTASHLIRANEQSKIGIHTALINIYYDFHNSTNFTPYIGGGLGIAVLHGKLERASIEAPNQNVEFETDLEGDYGDAQFAWGLSVGVNYELNKDWSLDLIYKFTNAGNNSYTSDIASVGLESKIKIHDFLLGVRYTF